MRLVAVWMGAFTLVFMLRFVYVYFDDLANNEAGTMPSRIFEEATCAYTAALVFLLLASFARRFPVRAERLLVTKEDCALLLAIDQIVWVEAAKNDV